MPTSHDTFRKELERARNNALWKSAFCNGKGEPCPRAIGCVLKQNDERGDCCRFKIEGTTAVIRFVKGSRNGEEHALERDEFLPILQTVFAVNPGTPNERKLDLSYTAAVWRALSDTMKPKAKTLTPRPITGNTALGTAGSVSMM